MKSFLNAPEKMLHTNRFLTYAIRIEKEKQSKRLRIFNNFTDEDLAGFDDLDDFSF